MGRLANKEPTRTKGVANPRAAIADADNARDESAAALI